jgi:glutamyl-tRNA synthetase
MVQACYDDLEWLGLDWDGEPELQSDRSVDLQAIALELHARGLAYPCTCTRKEIELARSAPHAEDKMSTYPGTCRDRYSSLEEARRVSGREACLRLRVDPGTSVSIQDSLQGLLTQDISSEVGDFPITSRDQQVAYQLAVVVDDARQGVTEVLRGDDLLESAPRQAHLLSLLGLPHPTWIHVPLVLDESGERLAKRHDSLSLRSLRESGISAPALRGWLGRSLGLSVPVQASIAQLLAVYDLSLLPTSAVVFSGADLKALKEAK